MPSISDVIAFAAKTPIRLLIFVWLGAVLLYLVGPIRYEQVPRPSTWLFVVACLFSFGIGSFAASRSLATRAAVIRQHPAQYHRIDQIVRATALIGLFGALCIVIDKVVLSGLDFSQGVGAVRSERAEAVAAGAVVELRRSPLLYLGYLTFSFSVASFVLYLLNGDSLRRSTVCLAFMGLASIFAYSYLYGGRSPLALVVGLAAGAIAVRLLTRQAALPRGRMGVGLFALFLVLTVAYSEAILSERLVAGGVADLSDLETRFETSYDATVVGISGSDSPTASPTAQTTTASPASPSAPIGSVVTASPAVSTTAAPLPAPSTPPVSQQTSRYEQLMVQAIVNVNYLTHELPMLDRTLAYEGPLGPYYGAHQFYLGAALVQRLFPGWNVDVLMVPQLKSANVYGWYSTAWGGMYLDFGVIGALVGILVCGWLAGRVYRRALINWDPGARLLMCYVVAGVIATPLLSIFTISISLLILMSLLVTAWILRPVKSSAAVTPAMNYARG
jgi:hypothetical protein